jgi:hypothetical protein
MTDNELEEAREEPGNRRRSIPIVTVEHKSSPTTLEGTTVTTVERRDGAVKSRNRGGGQ